MLDPRSPVPHYADHNEGGVCRIHGWRCLHITMLAVFADHDDGGCLQITMMAVFADHEDGGARGPQPDTIQNNDSWPPQHSHLSRAHRAPCPPPAVFLASSSLSPPQYHTTHFTPMQYTLCSTLGLLPSCRGDLVFPIRA